MSVNDICREHGISQPTFFNWKKKYSGMDASHLKRLKELETENLRLKRMFADVSLQRDALKDYRVKPLLSNNTRHSIWMSLNWFIEI